MPKDSTKKQLTESQRTEIEKSILGNRQWTKEFKKLAKKGLKKINNAMDDGDYEKAQLLETECVKKLAEKVGDIHFFSAWRLAKVLADDELSPEGKLLKDQFLLLDRFRTACFELELNPGFYIDSVTFQPLLVDLWQARDNETGELEKVWKDCLTYIGKKISTKGHVYPEFNRSLMLLAHYHWLHEKMKELCQLHPKLKGVGLHEFVSETYPELEEIYAESNSKGDSTRYQRAEPSYFAMNLMAKWNRISYKTLSRRLSTANKHIEYLKKEEVDYTPNAFTRFDWARIHNQKEFDLAMQSHLRVLTSLAS